MLDSGRHFGEVSFSTKSFMRFDYDDYTWKRLEVPLRPNLIFHINHYNLNLKSL
jgi:hypothetical protein